jgi:predicted methyltransferase
MGDPVIAYKPIGVIRSGHVAAERTPIQPAYAAGCAGRAEILPDYADGLRDLIRPPRAILREAGLGPGMAVLDFGCGPGGFSVAAVRLVGPAGRVYALDLRPEVIQNTVTADGFFMLDGSGRWAFRFARVPRGWEAA